MTSQVNEIFEAFAQAKDALSELPKVRGELFAITVIDNQDKVIAELKAKLEASEAKASALEVERDDAGFRELEANEKLENILKAVGVVTDTLSAKVKEVKPEPEVEQVQDKPEVEEVRSFTDYDNTAYTLPVIPEGKYPTEVHMNEDGVLHLVPIAEVPQEPSAEEVQAAPRPFEDWHDKPYSVSWKDFINGGGRRPYWLNDHDIEQDHAERNTTSVS
jgi:hypothetical protein